MEQLNNPTIELTFEANDLESGHSTSQILGTNDIVFHSFTFTNQLLNGLKSSSDQVSLQLRKGCPAIEDIIATEGNIKAVLKENGTTIFTGYISTNFTWTVTVFGEEAVNITIESVGTRLLPKFYLESGREFLDCNASAAIYAIARRAGIITDSTNLSVLTMPVMKVIEAGTTCRDLIDQLCYEIGYVYHFNSQGVLLVKKIEANTTGATLIDSESLYSYGGAAISLTKSLRTYKGARVTYTDMGKADNYLVYRNTTGQSDDYPYCKLDIPAGKYFDGVDFYTSQEWQDATTDEFHEPALISACNAASESSIVGSGSIVAISNLKKDVKQGVGKIDTSFTHNGGNQFTLVAHNTSPYDGYLMRLDLYASIVYEKSKSIVRTSIDGTTGAVFEETLEWVHSKENAQEHANLVAQYNKTSGSRYSFYSVKDLELGKVIHLKDNVHSNLDVYVLLVAKKWTDSQGIAQYTAVGISTFNLDREVYYQTSDEPRPAAPQGIRGADGEGVVVEYALGTSADYPPSSDIVWASEDIFWGTEKGTWDVANYTKEVPTPNRGQYVWMRTKVGDEPWQYTRLTGSSSQDASYFGVIDTSGGYPTHTPDGKNLVVGDSLVDSETNAIKVYNGSNWVSLSASGLTYAKQSEIAGKAQKDVMSRITPDTVTSSDYAYFNTLIVGTVNADYIKGKEGVFDSIHIGGNSILDGELKANSLETFSNQSAKNLSFTGQSFTKETLDSVFGSYGLFTATSGSVTISGNTYSASVSNPVRIYYGDMDFELVTKITIGTQVVSYGIFTSHRNGDVYTSANDSITSNSLVLPKINAHVEIADIMPFYNENSSLGSSAKSFSDVWIRSNTFADTASSIRLPNGMFMQFGTLPSSSMTYNEDTGLYSCSIRVPNWIHHLRFAMASWGFVNLDVSFDYNLVTLSTDTDGFKFVKYILITDQNS